MKVGAQLKNNLLFSSETVIIPSTFQDNKDLDTVLCVCVSV